MLGGIGSAAGLAQFRWRGGADRAARWGGGAVVWRAAVCDGVESDDVPHDDGDEDYGDGLVTVALLERPPALLVSRAAFGRFPSLMEAMENSVELLIAPGILRATSTAVSRMPPKQRS